MTSSPTPLHHATTLKTALLLVDIQLGLTHPTSSSTYFGTTRSTPLFESNITTLLSSIRHYNTTQPSDTPDRKVCIVHVYHNSIHPESPLYPGNPTNGLMPCATPLPDEPILSKNVNCAFINTNLETLLRSQGIRQLIICGISTSHCVSTTVRLASDLGVVKRKGDDDGRGVVAVVSDACAAFNEGRFDAETVHEVNLASLEGEFAKVVTVEDVLGIVR
jgi:nicotinamidase-related amidase